MIDFSTLKELSIAGIKLVELFINGVQVWKSGFKNWVKYSTEADGKTIYNGGLGYRNGYRLSSSGEEKVQTNAVSTGFIPATPKDIIRMAGVSWKSTINAGYTYICFYDAKFNKLAHINEYQGQSSNGVANMSAGTVLTNDKRAHNITADANGVYTFDLDYQSGASFSYIRISAEGNGADMIVTINEPIE